MKVLLNILFLLFCSVSFGQVFQTNTSPYKFKGLIGDSINKIPIGVDTPFMVNPKWGQPIDGALYVRRIDSTMWVKIGPRWVKMGSQNILDSTEFSPVIDSTGQDNFRVLFANGKRILGSDQLVYDSVKNILKINSTISTAGYGLAVGDNAIFQGLIRAMSVPLVDDTTNYKPLVFSTVGNKIVSRFGYWPSGGGGSGSVEYVVSGLGIRVDSAGRVYTVNVDTASSVILTRQRAANTYLGLSDTSTMLSNYLRGVGYSLARSGQTVYFDSTVGQTRERTENTYSKFPGGGQYAIQYSRNGVLAGNQLFVYDTVNRRVGIGIAAPLFAMHVESSNSGDGVFVRNSSSTGEAAIFIGNNQALSTAAGTFSIYGSSWAATQLRNQVAFGSRQGLLFLSNSTNTTGGTDPLDFYTGGGAVGARFVRMKSYGMSMYSAGTAADPGASAILDMVSTTKGILIPRMTATQRLAITPANGLMVIDSDSTYRPFVYNGGAWKGLAYTDQTGAGGGGGSGITSLNGLTGATQVFALTGTVLSISSVGVSHTFGLATQAAGTILNNATSSVAAPTATASPRIGTDIIVGSTSAIAASAVAELVSTTKGFLMPRGTSAQRTSISSPATGLQFFDTDSASVFVYDGTEWEPLDKSDWSESVLTGADVTMTTAGTWYTGATLVLPAGTWDITSNISVSNSTGANLYTVRIYNGSAAVSAGWGRPAGAGNREFTISPTKRVTISGTTTFTLDATSDVNGALIKYTVGSQAGATQMSATRIR